MRHTARLALAVVLGACGPGASRLIVEPIEEEPLAPPSPDELEAAGAASGSAGKGAGAGAGGSGGSVPSGPAASQGGAGGGNVPPSTTLPKPEPSSFDAGAPAPAKPDAALPAPKVYSPPIWDFETTVAGWRDVVERSAAGAVRNDPTVSTERAYSGRSSLKYVLATRDAKDKRYIAIEDAKAIGRLADVRRIVYHLWLPADHKVTLAQAYVIGNEVAWASVNQYMQMTELVRGGWTTFELLVPEAYRTVSDSTVESLGFELWTDPSWSGAVYVDAISFERN